MGKIVKLSNWTKTLNYIKKNGFIQAYYAVKERVHTEMKDDYRYEPLTDFALREQIDAGIKFNTKFSILVPAYETREVFLRAMVDSVLDQTYGNFELIIADASASDQVEQVIKSYSDKRIIYKRLKQNAGISANTNQALMYATGDYAGLLDHDDLLTPDALFEMAACIAKWEEKDIQLQLLYSDEDKCNGAETAFFEVNRKREFNLDLILSNNYICHFMVVKRQLMQEMGFRTICDGAQDYDMVLRCVSYMMGKDKKIVRTDDLPIAHISKVLYHWRCHEQSTAQNPASKQYAYDAGKRAIEDFLRMRGWKGNVSHTRHLGFYRVDYQPDVFTNRTDIGIVGGKLLDKKNKITGGIYTADGEPLYLGLHKEYSGTMHRAALQQEVDIVDIRCMKCAPQAVEILEEMLGLPYLTHPKTGNFDWRDSLNREVDYKELSRKFCLKVKEKGYHILWDPCMTDKV